MITVYCTEKQLRSKLVSLFHGRDFCIVENWRQFKHASPSAECSIIVLEWLNPGDRFFQQLCAFKRRSHCRPVILVTRKDADNARHLKDILVEEVVWLREIERTLPAIVSRTRARSQLVHIAEELEGDPRLPSKLREALAFACRSEQPLYSVAELARIAGRDRRTLCRYWRVAVGPDCTLRLQDFLSWLLLLRAVELRLTGRKLRCIAMEIGAHEHTLARLAKRLMGQSLQELTTEHSSGMVPLFTKQVLSHLTPGDTMRHVGTT
jgi:hypothetical protein